MTTQTRLWVLIADGEHARVVTPVAADGQFKTLTALNSDSAHLRSADLGSDRPGRGHESASTGRHAVSPRTDPHDNAKHQFALEIAKFLVQRDASGEFDTLVLVAPPHTLNDVRAALSTTAEARIVGTLHKDLVKVPDHDLKTHLAEWWLAPAEAAT